MASTSPGRRRDTRIALGTLAIITFVGLGARLYHLSFHSLWLDEVITAESVRFKTFGEVLGWAAMWVDNTPFLFVLTWLLRPLGGDEVAIRLPLAIAGTLTIPAMYWLGCELASRRAGLVAAILVALAPFAIYYSQEGRIYAILMLVTTLQMAFAYRVALAPRRFDWVGLATFTVLAMEASHLGLASSAAALAFIVIAMLLYRALYDPPQSLARSLLNDRRARDAALALIVAVLAYLPLTPLLAQFLSRSDLGFGRVTNGTTVTLDGLAGLLAALDVRGPVTLLVLIGLVHAMVRSVRDRDPASLLLLTWIVVPVAGYVAIAGAGVLAVWPRYFAGIYPALILLAARGLLAVAGASASFVRWLGRSRGRAELGTSRAQRIIVGVTVVALLSVVLVDWLPTVANSYVAAKGEDNRGAVDAIVGVTGPNATVVALGQNREWLLETIGYYLWLRGSSIPIVDGADLGDLGLARLQGSGDLYAVILDGRNVIPAEPPAGARFERAAGLTIVRAPDDGAPQLDRLTPVLDWAASFAPDVAASRRLIELLGAPVQRPGNLLAGAALTGATGGAEPMDTWALGPGVTSGPDGSFTLAPSVGESNATITTRVGPGTRYALTFGCTGAAGSAPRVYVTEGSISDLGRAIESVAIHPDGGGYDCTDDGIWRRGGFLFRPGPQSREITIWLRAAAPTARFRDVRLETIR